ncbi:MAG TPA: SgcJ/EcaC family oxidoreductase [Pseudomonadales bacterium]
MPLVPDPISTLANAYTTAWNSGSADAVAAFFSEGGSIVINQGEPWLGRQGVAEMANGFYTDVPDLSLTCDEVRAAGSHAVYMWTFTGHHATTGRPLTVRGWEEWDLDEDGRIAASRGWFDAQDYARQVAGS